MDNVKVEKMLNKVRVRLSKNMAVSLVKFLEGAAEILSDKEIDDIDHIMIEHIKDDEIKIKKVSILSDK